MAFVIKTSPRDAETGAIVAVTEPSMYGGGTISRGDEAFLWFSGRQGGSGLALQGHVADVTTTPEGKLADACVVTNAATQPIGKDDLEPWRDVNNGSAMAGP